MTDASIKFKWNNTALEQINRNVLEGMFEMAYDMARKARKNAPVVTSALRNSIRVQENGYIVEIRAGGVVAQSTRGAKYVDYAMLREIGPNNPNAPHAPTEHYMERAMHEIMSGDYMQHYFGNGKVTK